ncbi:MAG: adenylate kinase [Parcubacteria bacterium C7867-001]|nr:MAG: adenylate kinase [Parcubacteria bacterium C7867-001]
MTDTPKTVFFIGKPGSGKGTQAKLLAAKTGWTILASGAQFREIAKEESLLGRKVEEALAQGLLMPHWFAMYLYQRALFSVPEDQSIVFDGFNRKLAEAELNIATLEWLGRPFVVLNIQVSDEHVKERLAERAKTSGRSDDRQDAFDERLDEYRAHTTQSIDLFREKHSLIDINGEQTPEEVFADICKALNLE